MMRWRRSEWGDESGQALVLAAFFLLLLTACIGLAVDVGQLRYAKRHLQMAADAAALAGALEIPYCNGVSNCAALQTAAQASLVENGFAGGSLSTNCAAGSANALSIVVNHPACALGGNDPHRGSASFVEVLVSQPQPTMFARLLGVQSVPITARAEAGRSGGTNCIFALDPNGGNAISVDLFATIHSSCGIMDESSAWNALSCNLFSWITASQINVVGGFSNFPCSSHPYPTTGVSLPYPGDPLAALPAPAVPGCGVSSSSPYHGSGSTLYIGGTATLYPDAAYCGGIVIFPGAHVTFQPGVYVLTSRNGAVFKYPGGLAIDMGSAVTGTGVTFYNYGPSGGVTFSFAGLFSGGVNLVAPTTGTYAGILFFQDTQNTTQAMMIGSPSWSTVLEGAYYFPRAKVVFALSGAMHYNILVAYDIEFAFLAYGFTNLQSSFSNNYASLANGSPIGGNGAVLVQ